jgi:hypothetical protein
MKPHDTELYDLADEARRIDPHYTCGVLMATVMDPENSDRQRRLTAQTFRSFVESKKWELFQDKLDEAKGKSSKLLRKDRNHGTFIRYALDQLGTERVADLTPETIDEYIKTITRYAELITELERDRA